MAEIVLDQVTKRYPDGALAVDKVSMEIADGEFVILVGPSGCGKSTTLNMIAGLEDISDGELRIGGKVVNNMAPKDRDIAMVFQSYALYPHMTVRENMAFALKLAKTPQKTIDEKVEEAARVLDLTDHLSRKPANLSGGHEGLSEDVKSREERRTLEATDQAAQRDSKLLTNGSHFYHVNASFARFIIADVGLRTAQSFGHCVLRQAGLLPLVPKDRSQEAMLLRVNAFSHS